MEGVSKDGNSTLVIVPDGAIPAEIVQQSKIMPGGGGRGGGGFGGEASGAGVGGEGDIDPELAWAIRLSRMEEEQRMTALTGLASPSQPMATSSSQAAPSPGTQAAIDAVTASMEGMGGGEMDEDALLAAALALSLQDEAAAASAAALSPSQIPPSSSENQPVALNSSSAAMVTDELPIAGGGAESTTSTLPPPTTGFQDPAFVNEMMSMMGSLPGLDSNDPAVKEAKEALEKAKGSGEGRSEGEKK